LPLTDTLPPVLVVPQHGTGKTQQKLKFSTAVFLQAPAEVFCLPAGMPPEPHSTNLFQKNPCAAPHTTAAALHTLTIPTSTHTQQPQQPNRRPPGGLLDSTNSADVVPEGQEETLSKSERHT